MSKQTRKAVLITGCSSGIGLNAAQYLSNRGFHTIASVRQAKDIAKLQALKIECIQLDLASEQSISQAVEYISQNHPQLYGLVNNGAYGQTGAVEDLSRAALREQFETNLFGTHELTQKLMPLFLQQDRGRVIQVSSVLGFIALPMRGAYNASKFALEGLTDTQRLELQATNIHMSIVEPGAIETHFRQNSFQYFEKNIDAQNSRFIEQYKSLKDRLNRNENARFTLQAERVSYDIHRALTANKPKIRYRITVPTIVGAKLKRLLSDRMMDKICGNNG